MAAIRFCKWGTNVATGAIPVHEYTDPNLFFKSVVYRIFPQLLWWSGTRRHNLLVAINPPTSEEPTNHPLAVPAPWTELRTIDYSETARTHAAKHKWLLGSIVVPSWILTTPLPKTYRGLPITLPECTICRSSHAVV